MPFTKLENLLDRSVKKAGLSHRLEYSKIFEAFVGTVQNQFGLAAASKVRPLYIKDRVLTVACLSAPLVEAIQAGERQLLEALNQPYQQKIVETLRFIT